MVPSGQKAVIIGNGSSVDMMPPEFWNQDCLYIGCNRALSMKALQGARLDAVVIRDTFRNMWADPDVGWRWHKDVWQKTSCYKVGPAFSRNTHCDEFVRQADGWQFTEERDANREMAVMRNGSVVIMACNIAFLWGVREFHLTGVDYRGKHAAMMPGYDVSTGNEWVYDKPVNLIIEKQFRVMCEAIESVGGTIVNHSPGTRLQAVKETAWQFQRQTESTSKTTPDTCSV